MKIFLAKLLLTFAISLGGCATAADSPPLLSVPLRVHLVQSDKEADLQTTLTKADVERIIGKANKVWSPAGVRFQLESVRNTVAVIQTPPERDGKSRWVTDAIPKAALFTNGLNVCYVKHVAPNGFWSGKIAVVKDTASLKEVPGGIDEPLPRVTAHELGHALGLPHRQNVTNLMASGTTGFSLTEHEIQTARARAVERWQAKPVPAVPRP
ncbi:MAG: matrixin family metalloprotease [Verrucomicrobia bacterium]|nr:matrixin family metalloprotease [Verrucomicrobiota bacterium]